LEEWGIADGSVLAIVDFVEELRGEECETSSKRRKVEDEDMTLSLNTRVKIFFLSYFWAYNILRLILDYMDSYARMDPPIYMDPYGQCLERGPRTPTRTHYSLCNPL
ncbi:3856_t:CDS:2, partial [Funneliformis geosporum]